MMQKKVKSLNLNVVSTLAKTIVDPHDHKPLRMPTFPSIERTSLLGLVGTAQAVVPGPDTGSLSHIAVLCRSPAAPLWMTSNRYFAGYNWFQFVPGTSPPALPTRSGESLDLSSLMIAQPSQALSNWPIWPGLGQDAQTNYWFWAPASMQIFVSLITQTAMTAGAWSLELEMTADFTTTNTVRKRFPLVVDGQTLYLQSASSGWFYRPINLSCITDTTPLANIITNLRVGAITGGTPQIPAANASPYLCPVFQFPFEFSTAPIIYNSCRANAVSALFQNTTAVLNKDGSVEGLCLPLSFSHPPILSNTFDFAKFAADTNVRSRWAGLLEKGVYSFTLPDEVSTKFRDCNMTVEGGGQGAGIYTNVPLFNLDACDYLNVIKFTDYGSPGTNLFLTVDVHHEFRSTSMLWPVGFSTCPLEDWHRAQIVTQQMSVFHENPTHLAAIAALARIAATRLYPYAAPIVTAGLRAARDQVFTMAANALSKRMSGQASFKTAPSPPQKRVRNKFRGGKFKVK